MIHQIKSYLLFLISSTNQHGVHSPFVYNLVTKCLYKSTKKYKSELNLIEKYRKVLLNSKQTIKVTDFGAGSKIFKSNSRNISDIAKNAGMSPKKVNLILKLLNYFKPVSLLEIGTSLGIGTSCFSIGNPNSKITTLEGCPATAVIANKQFGDFNLKNIQLKVGKFEETLEKEIDNQKFDLIFFDGNHQEKATINYFLQCLSSINNNSIFIFDDIHWNKEMENAWKFIKNHKKVTVSIDTFYLGIVFFRNEQRKEHFNIRV